MCVKLQGLIALRYNLSMEKQPTMTPGERLQWAQKLGISERYLYQCLSGRREMSAILARRIESESAGSITRQMLRTKSWAAIWPELTRGVA